MQNKTVLITGSTDGIGKETAIELAKKGATVLIHSRSSEKGEQVVTEIKSLTSNNNIEFFSADFTSLNQVKLLSNKINEKYESLDVLINNAGVYMKKRVLTEDRNETTFQVNHLAHFLLTNLLLDIIKKNNPSRIINVSSMAHSSAINFNDLQNEKNYSGYGAYALSKLANILFTFKLADKLRNTKITVNCLHPGVINTKLLREGFRGGGRDVKAGSKIPVFLASSSKVEGVTGKFFASRIKGLIQKEQRAADVAYDKDVQDKLWKVSAMLTGLKN